MNPALSIKDLNKHYATVKALDNVNIEVAPGTVTGLIGPNGAGKTTLLRIINHILLPDSGSVEVFDHPVSFETTGYLGYMPEERGLYEKLRVEDQILYFGKLKGGNPSRLREVMREYMRIFELEGQERRRVKELSKGNQQKVQIIATLVHEPKLVILDEPFSGFDPINGALLTQLIERLRERDTTIILSSHNMSAIEEMCSNIALINKGRILLQGDLNEIKENHKEGKMRIVTRSPISIPLALDSEAIESAENVVSKHHTPGYHYTVSKASGATNNNLLHAIALQGEIMEFREELPSLADIFIMHTTGKLQDNNSAISQDVKDTVAATAHNNN